MIRAARKILSTRSIISAASAALTRTCLFTIQDSVIPSRFIQPTLPISISSARTRNSPNPIVLPTELCAALNSLTNCAESTNNFATSNKRKSLDTVEIGMFDSHNFLIGEQLFWIIVYQLPIDKDVASMLDDFVNFILWRFRKLYINCNLTNMQETLILSVSIDVLAISIRASNTFCGWLTPGFLSNKNPSSAIAHFVILDTGHIYQNLGSGIINANAFKDSSTVISDMYLSRGPALRYEYLIHALRTEAKSPMAIAPTTELNLAISAFSSSASFLRIRTGFKETLESKCIKVIYRAIIYPFVISMTREPFVMLPENRVLAVLGIERITSIYYTYNMRDYGRRVATITMSSQRGVRRYFSSRNDAKSENENLRRTLTTNVHESRQIPPCCVTFSDFRTIFTKRFSFPSVHDSLLLDIYMGRQESRPNSELMLETSRGDNTKLRFSVANVEKLTSRLMHILTWTLSHHLECKMDCKQRWNMQHHSHIWKTGML
ncbi:hypothetical protein DBV15_02226, partial [Temnothorax longispinosus]